MKPRRKTIPILGTPEEVAHVRRVEAITGIDVSDFLSDVAETDPHGNDGRCIFCKARREHEADCLWVKLNRARSDGAA